MGGKRLPYSHRAQSNKLCSSLDQEVHERPGQARAGRARTRFIERLRWPALTRYVDDGRIEIDNSAAERALRGVAIGRSSYLFMGFDEGGERAASLLALVVVGGRSSAALSGVRLELVVVSAEQLHQLGMNEQLLFAERHFAQHAHVSQFMQIA